MTMIKSDEHILQEAIAWYLRLEQDDSQSSDWEEFTLWLEQSPDHPHAYDQVMSGDAGLDALAHQPNQASPPEHADAANDNRPFWVGATAAAAAMLLAAFWLLPSQNHSDFQTFQTGPGEIKTIALGATTSITLNGGSSINVDMAGKRRAELDRGEALFTVEHDAAAPFTVQIGADRVVDLGTVFNIVRMDDDYSVSVAKGRVVVNPQAEAIPIAPGERISRRIGISAFSREALDPAAVTDWTRGQLMFADTPLSQVAAELERNIGKSVKIDPNVQDVRFTGTLQIRDDSAAVFEGLAAMTGISANATDDGWRLSR